ncbi:hypothetical protein TVAG_379620 [Trichomonas vaginalis G3]|uniref:Uncharacterized protein n=1 Tax=Trichomonas vaginalis (strain ATCC PRA-98 / G3) TaxID=412133 RepID=A2E7I7_TRIV3|nr:hypothetical protein TVAGG3_0339710 [Trichomonas vaginalis G3]EAY11380.1 hypothetical protein TVAG_379620 [Trichomonas vaginalis G3]KAI5530545.1 hypothetical protein TVAGG3_0339710 [Trichomonas vaginalis G3]|eukprot:XP_001323603.1 hypothetical protein [Trichomonas vaginalis G3]
MIIASCCFGGEPNNCAHYVSTKIGLALFCVIIALSIIYFVYSLLVYKFDLKKYKIRFLLQIALIAFSSSVMGLEFFADDTNNYIGGFTFLFDFAGPSFLISFLTILFYYQTLKFAQQLNISFAFGELTKYIAWVYFLSTFASTIFILLLVRSEPSVTFTFAWGFSTIIDDVIFIFIIIIPIYKILFSTLQHDSLKLMTAKTISSIVVTSIFCVCLVGRLIQLVFDAWPADQIDPDNDALNAIADRIMNPDYFGYHVMILFAWHFLYYIYQNWYFDSILVTVEGTTTTNSVQGSLYIEASKKIE